MAKWNICLHEFALGLSCLILLYLVNLHSLVTIVIGLWFVCRAGNDLHQGLDIPVSPVQQNGIMNHT